MNMMTMIIYWRSKKENGEVGWGWGAGFTEWSVLYQSQLSLREKHSEKKAVDAEGHQSADSSGAFSPVTWTTRYLTIRPWTLLLRQWFRLSFYLSLGRRQAADRPHFPVSACCCTCVCHSDLQVYTFTAAVVCFPGHPGWVEMTLNHQSCLPSAMISLKS